MDEQVLQWWSMVLSIRPLFHLHHVVTHFD
jgi:hypothetical protein